MFQPEIYEMHFQIGYLLGVGTIRDKNKPDTNVMPQVIFLKMSPEKKIQNMQAIQNRFV